MKLFGFGLVIGAASMHVDRHTSHSNLEISGSMETDVQFLLDVLALLIGFEGLAWLIPVRFAGLALPIPIRLAGLALLIQIRFDGLAAYSFWI